MAPTVAWALSAACLVAGFVGWGWRGIVLALTVIAFWLLLQFSRTLRVLRGAASAPVGHVDSAVMLHARLRPQMQLAEVIAITRSLGRKTSDRPETYVWRDDGGDELELECKGGRCARWQLRRAEPTP